MIHYLKKHFELGPKAVAALQQVVETKEYRQGEHLFHSQNNCYDYFFVSSGLARVYVNDDQGKEQTLWLVRENRIVSPMQALLRKRKLRYSCELQTSARVNRIFHADLVRLMSQFPELTEAFMGLFCQFNDDALSYIAESKKPCQNRLLSFMRSNREVYGMMQFRHLASYLGVTPETLSRVKRAILKQEI
ncbi:MAG: Crp/Fnr family transcriptional regulator [Mangrovibacterium sp.]